MTPEPGIPTLEPGGQGEVDRRAKKELMARLERDAQRICRRFRLRYRVLEPERANVKRRYGVCFSDGTIRTGSSSNCRGEKKKTARVGAKKKILKILPRTRASNSGSYGARISVGTSTNNLSS